MGGTSIKRKALRNKLRAKQRLSAIKLLTSTPVQKNVDIEELKASFNKKEKIEKTPVEKKEKAPEAIVEVKTVSEEKPKKEKKEAKPSSSDTTKDTKK